MANPMSLEELECKIGCNDTLVRLCAALDGGDNAAAADCFSDDAEAKVGGHDFAGPALREHLLGRASWLKARHLLTNVLITPTGPTTAKGTAYITAFRVKWEGEAGSLPPLPESFQAVGGWEVEFVKTDDGWKVSRYIPVNTFVAKEFLFEPK